MRFPNRPKRGEILFFNRHLSCFRCHGGFNFTDSTVSERNAGRSIEFHNTGLYNVRGSLSYPASNVGIFEFTKTPADVGKFKAPTLRNIAVTAPYMHDGSIARGSKACWITTRRAAGRSHPALEPEPDTTIRTKTRLLAASLLLHRTGSI
jgi:cytochrome c peroxidase